MARKLRFDEIYAAPTAVNSGVAGKMQIKVDGFGRGRKKAKKNGRGKKSSN